MFLFKFYTLSQLFWIQGFNINILFGDSVTRLTTSYKLTVTGFMLFADGSQSLLEENNRVNTMVLKAGIAQDSLRRWQKSDNDTSKEELHVVNRTWKKEKSTSEGEVLRKTLRFHSNNTCSDELSELLEVAVTVRISKRKASTKTGAHSKKLRCENNCSGESVDRASETGLLKTSFEQIPAAKTTTTTKRGCDVLPGSSGLSASRMNNGCVTLSGKNSKGVLIM